MGAAPPAFVLGCVHGVALLGLVAAQLVSAGWFPPRCPARPDGLARRSAHKPVCLASRSNCCALPPGAGAFGEGAVQLGRTVDIGANALGFHGERTTPMFCRWSSSRSMVVATTSLIVALMLALRGGLAAGHPTAHGKLQSGGHGLRRCATIAFRCGLQVVPPSASMRTVVSSDSPHPTARPSGPCPWPCHSAPLGAVRCRCQAPPSCRPVARHGMAFPRCPPSRGAPGHQTPAKASVPRQTLRSQQHGQGVNPGRRRPARVFVLARLGLIDHRGKRYQPLAVASSSSRCLQAKVWRSPPE